MLYSELVIISTTMICCRFAVQHLVMFRCCTANQFVDFKLTLGHFYVKEIEQTTGHSCTGVVCVKTEKLAVKNGILVWFDLKKIALWYTISTLIHCCIRWPNSSPSRCYLVGLWSLRKVYQWWLVTWPVDYDDEITETHMINECTKLFQKLIIDCLTSWT